ncbi:MAG: hypothetical protein FP825_02505 [Hyphomonas sp.]|uniref:hypothetical protein n=1 Tax=Hyphomonas sp. TaxID=87 RepID=UPI0017BD8002|nr:hypothetical protein [Hyphomonas sp.]MBU3920342.1 hypothetical protein [Alphaproteobacteria bacterium]MBA3067335.1 hypothetical protein [Hyphomonas sp.]MBU4063024.1 hypothetical protein [Alphaproteobacteria bacterium]MBU4163605.1 hypothetical protein [Alphaproteobacteria bacterium]MBU4569229.1 hypothetical protein [Alphaproteobacteria bacterium]
MPGEPGRADDTLPAYATTPRPKRVKRIRLALLVSSFAACLSVTLMGFVFKWLMLLAFGIMGSPLGVGESGFLGGAQMALQLASLNFFLFFITVPAAALALGLSIGRFPHKGITAIKPYLRWGGIWGAILVGSTTFVFGWFGGAESAAGALVAGSLVGAIAGAFCGFLLHAIVAPARQLTDVDVNVFGPA